MASAINEELSKKFNYFFVYTNCQLIKGIRIFCPKIKLTSETSTYTKQTKNMCIFTSEVFSLNCQCSSFLLLNHFECFLVSFIILFIKCHGINLRNTKMQKRFIDLIKVKWSILMCLLHHIFSGASYQLILLFSNVRVIFISHLRNY